MNLLGSVHHLEVGREAADDLHRHVGIEVLHQGGEFLALELVVLAAADGAQARVLDELEQIAATAALSAAEGAPVARTLADGLARAIVDGREVARVDVPTSGSGRTRAEVGGRDGAIAGAAIGAALVGSRPVVEIMFMDFLTISMNQLVNQAAKIRFMFGGKASIPMVIRAPAGSLAGVSAFQVHFASHEIHTPGDSPDVLVAMNPASLKANICLSTFSDD